MVDIGANICQYLSALADKGDNTLLVHKVFIDQ